MKSKKIILVLILFLFSNFGYSSQLLIGINKFVIWKFYEMEESGYQNRYLIFNPSDYKISIKTYAVDIHSDGILVSTTIDSAIETLPPISIKPSEFRIIDDFFKIEDFGEDRIYLFTLNDSVKAGYYKPENNQPDGNTAQRIITNSVPHSGSEMHGAFWSQDETTFISENHYQINLQINSSIIDSVLVLKSSSGKFTSQVDSILDLRSKTLGRKHYSDRSISDAYMFSVPNHTKESNHTISFRIKAPLVDQVTLMKLNAWLINKNGTMNISLPIIVTP